MFSITGYFSSEFLRKHVTSSVVMFYSGQTEQAASFIVENYATEKQTLQS